MRGGGGGEISAFRVSDAMKMTESQQIVVMSYIQRERERERERQRQRQRQRQRDRERQRETERDRG